jgi:glucose/arabinose dehydrogenase
MKGTTVRPVSAAVTALLMILASSACETRSENPQPPSTPDTVSVFLDISGRVASNPGAGELGLLGLAFHPQYETNGYFYINYTTGTAGTPRTRATRVSRFRVSPTNPDRADPESETILLEFPQPFDNHNGGQLAFGPDGYLHITTGDGGGGGDPLDNAQNLTTVLGKILRIDVSPATGLYAIPPDNPFARNARGFREEIFAFGLRNPWRLSFDRLTGRLWVADVGQATWEEINVVESGGNYGWDCREGAHVYSGPPGGPSPACASASNLIDPVWEYRHGTGDISITGGYVYRGPTVTSLNGRYVYGDFGSGRVWALGYDGVNPTVNTQVVDAPFLISSFGLDGNGELYVLQYATSRGIHRLVQMVASPGVYAYSLARVFDFYAPAYAVDLQHPGDATGRLFVVEQAGVIRVIIPGTSSET